MDDEVDQESKTEDPSPRRREEARRQGQVPFSSELVGNLVLLAGVIGLVNVGPGVWAAMASVFRSEIPRAYHAEFDSTAAAAVMTRIALQLLATLLPMFGILLAVSVGVNVAQVGFQLNTEKLSPNFDKLNPASGWSKLFSVASLVRAGLTLLKIGALGVIAYLVVEGRAVIVTSLSRGRLAGAAPQAWAVTMRLATYMAGAVAAVSVLDYVYQRYRFEKSLRMTKEEVKREVKDEQGDPQIKARIRQLARERSRRKMLAQVPKATVVVTNPTHYAVALRYDAVRDSAPVVVARGAGAFAKRIADLARQHGVAVLERPPLARALYASVKEGDAIPGALFKAVAEVLVFVYRLRGLAPPAPPPVP